MNAKEFYKAMGIEFPDCSNRISEMKAGQILYYDFIAGLNRIRDWNEKPKLSWIEVARYE